MDEPDWSAWQVRMTSRGVVAQEDLLDNLFGCLKAEWAKGDSLIGFVFDGPKGIGKMHIAEVFAEAAPTNASHKIVDFCSLLTPPEVEAAFYGSASLHIIILPMADGILAAKSSVPEQPMMAALLKCFLDRAYLGLLPIKRIVFIALALDKQGMHPDFLCEERLGNHIPVQLSSWKQRRDLLKYFLPEHYPLQSDDWWEDLSMRLPGFSPADIQAFIEVAKGAEGSFTDNLFRAVEEKRVQPSIMQTANTSLPMSRTADLVGMDALIEECRLLLRVPIDRRFRGIPSPRGILLYGPPGSGKTALGMALARESGLNYHYLEGSSLRSKYFGETENKVAEVFRRARQAAPCILLIDGIDRILPSRSASAAAEDESGLRMTTVFLTEIDGASASAAEAPVIVIGMARSLEGLDPAIIRPGRLGYHFALSSVLSKEAREEFIRKRIPSEALDLSEDEHIHFIKRTEGFSGADMEWLWREAAMSALRTQPAETVIVRWPELEAAFVTLSRRITSVAE